MITSTKNPKIKEIRLLQAQSQARREANAFVIEGIRLAEESIQAGWEIKFCLYDPEMSPRGLDLVTRLSAGGIPTEQAAEHVIKAASDTQSPQGILLIASLDRYPLPDAPDFILILDQIHDPGNMGTLLRTAAAAGVQAVLVSEGSADVFAPKVLRAGMGAHFSLPIRTLPVEEITAYCQERTLSVWASLVDEGKSYTSADFKSPAAIVIGSESHGVSPSLAATAQAVTIPMPGGTESLNAAAAGAILLYEVVRQRGSQN